MLTHPMSRGCLCEKTKGRSPDLRSLSSSPSRFSTVAQRKKHGRLQWRVRTGFSPVSLRQSVDYLTFCFSLSFQLMAGEWWVYWLLVGMSRPGLTSLKHQLFGSILELLNSRVIACTPGLHNFHVYLLKLSHNASGVGGFCWRMGGFRPGLRLRFAL